MSKESPNLVKNADNTYVYSCHSGYLTEEVGDNNEIVSFFFKKGDDLNQIEGQCPYFFPKHKESLDLFIVDLKSLLGQLYNGSADCLVIRKLKVKIKKV
jgi:hypothetical protein